LKLSEKERLSWDELFVHPLFNSYFADKKKEKFEDKLKMVMTDLRFRIKSENIDLNKLL
jgi:hypothetical protein